MKLLITCPFWLGSLLAQELKRLKLVPFDTFSRGGHIIEYPIYTSRFPVTMSGKFTREDGKNYLEFDMSSEIKIYQVKMKLKGTFRGVRTKLEP